MTALITKITTQKKNQERFNIYWDKGKGEEYAFSVDQDVLLKFRLKKGMEVDELELTEILFEDESKKAFNTALQFLSFRMRSEKEIRDYLKKKEMDDPVIQDVLLKLAEYNYINDREFAFAYVRTQSQTTLKGPDVIEQELREKGISRDLIKESLEAYEREALLENAIKLAGKAAQKDRNLSEMQVRQKIEQALLRKGYPWDIIKIALDETDYGKDEDEEWNAILVQGEKAHRRYQKYEGREYSQKMKSALFRKGFSIELIERLLEHLSAGED